MVDPEIIEEVKKSIDSMEADIRARIARGEGPITPVDPSNKVRPGASIYSDALDAVLMCRFASYRVTTAQDDPGYLLAMLRALEHARELYVETSADEGGYGNATFLMITREIRNLYESLDAIAEYLESQAAYDKLETH